MTATTLTTSWTEVTLADTLPAGSVRYSDGQVMYARRLRDGETAAEAKEDALAGYESEESRREVRRTFEAIEAPEGREDTAAEAAAYAWAKNEQGYAGTYAEWLDMPAGERAEYEDGAAGIGTV